MRQRWVDVHLYIYIFEQIIVIYQPEITGRRVVHYQPSPAAEGILGIVPMTT